MMLYNTLTRKKEDFKPINGKTVGFYSCGPTVYDYAHIGNLRTYIFSDTLKRTLSFFGYKVKHVMNITDVGHLTSDSDEGEDKIEKGAKREGKSVRAIAKFYEKAFFSDAKELNILKPTKIARATETISDQIKLIKKIKKAGYAYETESALYFDVSKFKDYGKLSGQSIEEKMALSREGLVLDSEKKSQLDFALWVKCVGKHKNHALRWKSPWGVGFPGWHIECSAISSKYLGQPFDIHTGGEDHIGTHHENEIAQSEVACGKPLAKIWMHTRHMVLGEKKMSKSSGEFITLSKLKQDGFDPLCFRYLCLTAHYRSNLAFSLESLGKAEIAYFNMIDLASDLFLKKSSQKRISSKYEKEFTHSIEDDLDTPGMVAFVWKLLKDKEVSCKQKIKILENFDFISGLDILSRAKRLAKEKSFIPEEIKNLAKERHILREKKDFKGADIIRLTLAKKGYEIKDNEKGYDIIHSKKSL